LESIGHRHPESRRLRALLRDPAARRDDGHFVLEGPRLVADAQARGYRLEAVYLAAGARQSFAPLIDAFVAGGGVVRELREGVLEKLGSTRTPQPVLAVAAMPAPVSVADLPVGLVVVAAGVADPGNLGTIVRSCEAAGAVAVVSLGGVDPWNPKVVRGSAGAVMGLPILTGDRSTVQTLRDRGWRTVAAEVGGASPYSDADLTGAVALVVGSEAHGVDPEIAPLLDATVTIPMAGPTESLNVAVAASILVFEAARQAKG
jgi:TrmH family RNA methyltransferase